MALGGRRGVRKTHALTHLTLPPPKMFVPHAAAPPASACPGAPVYVTPRGRRVRQAQASCLARHWSEKTASSSLSDSEEWTVTVDMQ